MVSSTTIATTVAFAYQAISASAASFCDASFTGSNVCLAEFSSTSSVTYRIGVQDAATSSTTYDTLLQIIAPIATGWTGLAWGGSMTNNPLTVAWPSTDNSAIVSSRWATGHTLPAAYTGATYRTLSSSKNTTHWTLSVVCTGCSQWSGGSLAASANTLAWASSTRAVTTPASNTSTFGYHTGRGTISVDLSTARVPAAVFEQYVAFLTGESGAPAPGPPPSSSAPPASSAPIPSSTPVAPPSSTSVASPPPPPPSSIHPHPSTSELPPPPASSDGGSITTVVSTVFITVTAPTTTSKAVPPSSSTPSGTIISSRTSTTSKPVPVPTQSSVDGNDGSAIPTITVTVIEGGTVPSGAPEPPIGKPPTTPIIIGGKKKTPPFLPPFHRPPPFGVPGWA
ncbi:hypothetical protein Sste5346_009192 [Sporothrix stenoceras]|uniref:Cellobiose dehydrogenase-like cytochrome domain-containing protein n=1 Tax=Sporothrix stenoceras TaxID=5173 RepID=A0ABR3YME9_9PEZI